MVFFFLQTAGIKSRNIVTIYSFPPFPLKMDKVTYALIMMAVVQP